MCRKGVVIWRQKFSDHIIFYDFVIVYIFLCCPLRRRAQLRFVCVRVSYVCESRVVSVRAHILPLSILCFVELKKWKWMRVLAQAWRCKIIVRVRKSARVQFLAQAICFFFYYVHYIQRLSLLLLLLLLSAPHLQTARKMQGFFFIYFLILFLKLS